MELTTWNPELLLEMQRNVFSNTSLMSNSLSLEMMELSGFLAADIIQTSSGYCLYADVPGMTDDDIHVSIENGVMTISGDRKLQYSDQGAETPVLNRFRGAFCVQFALSDQINFHRVSAKIMNGVLTVNMPVSDNNHPNQIRVPVSSGN